MPSWGWLATTGCGVLVNLYFYCRAHKLRKRMSLEVIEIKVATRRNARLEQLRFIIQLALFILGFLRYFVFPPTAGYFVWHMIEAFVVVTISTLVTRASFLDQADDELFAVAEDEEID